MQICRKREQCAPDDGFAFKSPHPSSQEQRMILIWIFLTCLPTPIPLTPRFNFLNVVINKKNSHILRYLPLILCLSDLNVTLPVFLATFHAKWERQGLLQFTAWQKPTHRKNWWERNMPHILIITHFGRETVIITERTVKCCSCGSVKGVHDFLLWIEI